MATYIQTVSGHGLFPAWPGPDNFANVGGRGWTDQQGFGVGTGKRFRILANKTVEFFAPITNPVIFNDKRLGANFAAVTLNLQTQDAFLTAFRVFDRLFRFFDVTGLSTTGNFSNVWAVGSNAFSMPTPPGRQNDLVDGHLVIAVTITTDAEAEVTFTGAGIQFHT